ncbi:MAG: endolytic transglycosylase MltG [candidate division Zixibacteria bacterium]|nr:endolytic transglycosylase MltG [candidate division Zixibacteria bacterium]
MVKRIDGPKFSIGDRLLWHLSNLLALAISLALVIAAVIIFPFRGIHKMSFRWLLKFTFFVGLIIFIFGAYLYYSPQDKKNFGAKTKYLIVRRGDTVFDIGYKLQQMGAVSSQLNFVIFAKLPWQSKKLKAGRFALAPGYSIAQIIGIITRGASVPYTVTIPEGLTIQQTAMHLSSQLEFEPSDFIAACTSRVMLDSLGIAADNLEGYLFPDTYDFFYDESAVSVVNKMVKRFFETLPPDFEEKAAQQGLDFDEAIILASMIEKEAMLDSERPIISAVYNSRLRKNMLLQCDPTVIYAHGGKNRPLYYSDLQIDSPYNTYKYLGLPPAPICSPGKASLIAAVNPADVDYLYFVAKGDGSHIFSYTNAEHESAKKRVRRTKLIGFTP